MQRGGQRIVLRHTHNVAHHSVQRTFENSPLTTLH